MDVTLVLTHDCNLGCGYCYAGAKFSKRMPPEIARKSLDLAFSDQPSKVSISYFGGEPLLAWEQLVESAAEAQARAKAAGAELKLSVTTNGTLLDDERAATLDELGVYVALSIDGVREAHDTGRPMMGGGSSFDGVQRGLEVLVRRGTAFETISVVTPENVRWLGESVRWLFAQGVPRVGLNPCYEATFDEAALALYEKGLRDASDVMIEHFRNGRIVSVTVLDNKILAAIKGGLAPADRCSLGESAVSVAPSGNLYPCERLVAEDEDPTYVMGHIDTGIAVTGEACARGPVNSECEPCGERWRCSSYCACANRAETGKTDVAGGTQCWHERTTSVVADRVAGTLWAEQNVHFLAWFYGRMTGAAGPPTEAAKQRGKPAGVVPRSTSADKKRLRVVP